MVVPRHVTNKKDNCHKKSLLDEGLFCYLKLPAGDDLHKSPLACPGYDALAIYICPWSLVGFHSSTFLSSLFVIQHNA